MLKISALGELLLASQDGLWLEHGLKVGKIKGKLVLVLNMKAYDGVEM
jgi:hypothetical protein